MMVLRSLCLIVKTLVFPLFFIYGCLVYVLSLPVWFRVKHSKKGDPELTRQAKKFIAFWLEKLQWEDFDNPVVIVQDMTGAGVSNMVRKTACERDG